MPTTEKSVVVRVDRIESSQAEWRAHMTILMSKVADLEATVAEISALSVDEQVDVKLRMHKGDGVGSRIATRIEQTTENNKRRAAHDLIQDNWITALQQNVAAIEFSLKRREVAIRIIVMIIMGTGLIRVGPSMIEYLQVLLVGIS